MRNIYRKGDLTDAIYELHSSGACLCMREIAKKGVLTDAIPKLCSSGG